jgi:hypothetical protein
LLGGHLLLLELKVIIKFPSGCTILLPSGRISHANAAIGPGEVHHALIQYCAGSLGCWILYGYKNWDSLPWQEQAQEQAAWLMRWQEVLALFSTSVSLLADRAAFNACFMNPV